MLCSSHSEDQLQPKQEVSLCDAIRGDVAGKSSPAVVVELYGSELRNGGSGSNDRRILQNRIWYTAKHRVQHVKCLRSELQRKLFGDPGILEKRHFVAVYPTRVAQLIACGRKI